MRTLTTHTTLHPKQRFDLYFLKQTCPKLHAESYASNGDSD